MSNRLPDTLVASALGIKAETLTEALDHPERATIRRTMLDQIGGATIMAVSGGPREWDGLTLRLPVRYGYAVEVEYVEGVDLYDVRRTFTRSGVRTVKAEETQHFCDTLADAVFRASCYHDAGEFGAES